MLLNETKGCFGMYSRAGVNSVGKFHILMKKEEILSGKKKHFIEKDMFQEKKNLV